MALRWYELSTHEAGCGLSLGLVASDDAANV